MTSDPLFHDIVVGAHHRLRTSLDAMTFFLNAESTVTEANLPHVLGAELAYRQTAPSSPYAGWTSLVEVPARTRRRIDMLIIAPDRVYLMEFKVFCSNDIGGVDTRAVQLRQQLDDCMSSDLAGLGPRIPDLTTKQVWVVGLADAWGGCAAGDANDIAVLRRHATLWQECTAGPAVVPGGEQSHLEWSVRIHGQPRRVPYLYAWVYGAWQVDRSTLHAQ